jgi:hypothetical protein
MHGKLAASEEWRTRAMLSTAIVGTTKAYLIAPLAAHNELRPLIDNIPLS